MKHYMVR